MIGVVVSENSRRVVDMFLILRTLSVALAIFLSIFSKPTESVGVQISQCAIQTHGDLAAQEWVYTAPPRFVPNPPVDPLLQQAFYDLFRFDDVKGKGGFVDEELPPGLSPDQLSFIAQVCPRNAFFYSMSPLHIQGRALLQNYFLLLPTPQDVLKVAKIILFRREINPKVWYYALMGAVMQRPDMSGITIPQPIDALPDMYIPEPVLTEALSRYQFGHGIGHEVGFGGGHYGAASSVKEHRVKFDRMLNLGNSSDSSVAGGRVKLERMLNLGNFSVIPIDGENKAAASSAELTSAEKFAKRRRTIIRRKIVKGGKLKLKKQSDDQRSSIENFTSRDDMEDNTAGAESIRVASHLTPNRLTKTTESSKLSTTSTSKPTTFAALSLKASTTSTTTPSPSSSSTTNKSDENPKMDDGDFGLRLKFGEDDDEYDELRRIYDNSNSTVKQITQRILQRRLRRKGDKKSHREKRQIFGPHYPIRECSIINGSVGINNGIENKLWYFREDLLVNQFHWWWHQMYPVNTTRHGDRRAELFFYVHRNLVARYNAERLSNGIPRTVELLLRHSSVIDLGFDPHLIDAQSGKFWTPRDHLCELDDVIHEQDPDFQTNIFLKDMNDLYHKLIFSIKDGAFIGINQEPVPVRNYQGIDLIGNTVEAADISINPFYYDPTGIHNLGHQLLALQQDPKFIHKLPTGVMGDTAVTMRDPVFFTFHAGIDNIFDRHKRTLPPYQLYEGDFPLVWPGVAISSFELVPNLNDGHINHIRTFWSMDRFPLESGVDNSIHNGEVKEDICAQHLNYEPFTYKITINVNPCVETISGQGTVRIFMAPRFDEFGNRFPMKVQRRLMFQLDVFPVKLHGGRNVILRRSQDNSLTKPWPRSLKQQAFQNQAGGGQAGPADFCGCGWPAHLLIPKGNPAGMPFDVFVMVTNFDQDVVQDLPEDLKIPEPCTSPYLFCGIPFRRYPDARPMNYPFDRLPYKVPVSCGVATGYPEFVCKMLQPQWFRPVETIEEYVSPAPNMATTVVVVQHTDTLIV